MRGFIVLLLSLLIVLSWAGFGHAQADWDVQRTFNLENPPLDVKLSAKGKWIFVLTDQGEILVYSPYGTLKDTISVGKSIDGIEPGPVDDVLLVYSRKQKTLEIITIDLVQNINMSEAPFKGPAEAALAIAVYTDFQAPACAKLAPVLEQVRARYPQQVKLVYKNFPLKSKHRFAGRAAVAALAAERQGKFWEFYELLFANAKGLNQKKIEELAGKLGLDLEKFKNDMRDPRLLTKIQQDMSEGAVAGVRVPPAVFINGRMVRNPTREGIEAAVEKELKKK
jgi:protein-disulfide isomerase